MSSVLNLGPRQKWWTLWWVVVLVISAFLDICLTSVISAGFLGWNLGRPPY